MGIAPAFYRTSPQPGKGLAMGTLSATELRQQRGEAIAELSRIVRKRDCWEVPSQSGAGKHYVFLGGPAPRDPTRCRDRQTGTRRPSDRHYRRTSWDHHPSLGFRLSDDPEIQLLLIIRHLIIPTITIFTM